MNQLLVGFARKNITPEINTPIDGYYKPRFAKGSLDALETNAVAIASGEKKVVLISIDACVPATGFYRLAVKSVCEATGLAPECVYLHATHTHTAGELADPAATQDEMLRRYAEFVVSRITAAAVDALRDLTSAKMGIGKGTAPNVAFVRRFIMKDGSVKTNPGVNNPDIVRPIGDVDEEVQILRFDREEKESVVLVHFANHPDVVGGEYTSGDWPGLLRQTVEKVLDGTKCIFFNGAQGDVNHVNVFPAPGYLNDTFNDFDDVSRGYGHARYIARVVTGGVLQAFDKVHYVDVDSIDCLQKEVCAPSQMPKPEEIPEAIRINELHQAGRDSELPYQGMMLTTVVAEAERMLSLKDGPEFFSLPLLGIRLGPVAFVGIPGEPFTGIGRAIKATEGFQMLLPTCLTGGSEGYYPMLDCFEEGGYEARSSRFQAGVAEKIIDGAKALLKEFQ